VRPRADGSYVIPDADALNRFMLRIIKATKSAVIEVLLPD
jgi:hypothetical protein